MSIRRSPPPPPDSPRRAQKEQFAELTFGGSGRTYEVTILELVVGGALIEFAGIAPPARRVGDSVQIFVDVGADLEGERVAGTVQAELICMEDGPGARTLLMWSGTDPKAAMVVNRLLTQQLAGTYDLAEHAGVA